MSFQAKISVSFMILVCCVATAVSASGQGHTIRGKVRNSAGVNMSRVSVNLETGTGAMINQTVTNNEGDFNFSGLSDNSYTLTVSAPDYMPVSERVEFVRSVGANEPGEVRTVEIVLSGNVNARTARREVSFVQNVPREASDKFTLGMQSLKNGRAQEAVTYLEQAIRIFPDYFDAHSALANQFILENKLTAAIGHLDQARRINPKDDRTYQAFGIILMRQQKYAVAARIFAEASRLNPRDLNYLVLQATALIDQAAAIDIKKSPAAADEQNYAFTEAEGVLNKAYELSGKKLATVHLQLARLYEKKGEPKRAASELEQFLHQSPNDQKAQQIREAITKLRGAPKQD